MADTLSISPIRAKCGSCDEEDAALLPVRVKEGKGEAEQLITWKCSNCGKELKP